MRHLLVHRGIMRSTLDLLQSRVILESMAQSRLGAQVDQLSRNWRKKKQRRPGDERLHGEACLMTTGGRNTCHTATTFTDTGLPLLPLPS